MKGDAKETEELEEEDGEELDEILLEILGGLTEMFPERVPSGAGAAFDLSRLCGSKTVQISQGLLVDWDHLLHDPGSPPCP